MKKKKVALKKLALTKDFVTDLSVITKESIRGGGTLPVTAPVGPNDPPDCMSCPNTIFFSCPNNC